MMEDRIERYRLRVYHFILKFIKDPELSEDLTQDVLLKVWLRWDKISHLEKMDSYILTISKNHVMDHFKRLARERAYQEEIGRLLLSSENRGEANLTTRDIEDNLKSSLEVLPARQQQVFELSRNKGLSLQEIAQKLDIAPNTAKNHLTRAMKVLRSRMKPENPGSI